MNKLKDLFTDNDEVDSGDLVILLKPFIYPILEWADEATEQTLKIIKIYQNLAVANRNCEVPLSVVRLASADKSTGSNGRTE